MNDFRARGQALVEVALMLPVLLILLAGAYASMRTAFLASRAESVAIAEAIRAGRNLPGIEPDLSRSIAPEKDAVEIRPGRKGESRLLPKFLPSLIGRTSATVTVRKPWPEIGNPQWLPTANILRKTNLSADCWDQETSSGRRIRQWIRGGIVLGAAR